jgi:hypothetical protein
VSRVGHSKFRLEPTTPEDIDGLLTLPPGDEVVTPSVSDEGGRVVVTL